jgi:hypothetical protein
MPTVTAGVTLNSTTLFPNSSVVSFTATEVVSGSALFQYTVVSASSNQIIYGPSARADESSTVYFYAQAATTNETNLILSVTGSNTSGSSFIILRPGDWTYFPFHVSASGCTVRAINTSATSSLLNIFYGARS